MVKSLASAKKQGHSVAGILDDLTAILKMESAKSSLPSIASGLKCWHAFATDVLGYPASATLPPRCPEDIIEFIAVFKSAGTARNYVSYVAWACKFVSLDVFWKSVGVNQALKGLGRREVRLFGGATRIEVILDNPTLQKLIQLTDASRVNDGFQILALLSWEFL